MLTTDSFLECSPFSAVVPDEKTKLRSDLGSLGFLLKHSPNKYPVPFLKGRLGTDIIFFKGSRARDTRIESSTIIEGFPALQQGLAAGSSRNVLPAYMSVDDPNNGAMRRSRDFLWSWHFL